MPLGSAPGTVCGVSLFVRLRLTVVDVVLGVVLVVLFFLPVIRAADRPSPLAGLLGVAFGVAYTGTVLTRKAWPLASSVAVSPLYLSWVAAGYEPHELQSLPAVVVVYWSGAAAISMRERLFGLVFMAAVFLVVATAILDVEVLGAGFIALLFVGVWWLGVTVAARRAYATELEEKTAELETAREELARQAVAEERARIARELYDVVTHAMSVITVQAGVGAHLIDERPERAAESLRIIEGTGREALGELRRMLNVLRFDAESTATKPQPGVSQLGELIELSGKAGIRATVAIEGPESRLPASLDLSIYRVVQESLTNAAKHAPGSRAGVTIRYRGAAVEVEVITVGGTFITGGGKRTDGLGLRGMADRAQLFSGAFEAGPTGDGFRVWASVPLEVT